jgi:hypothetical protein
MLEVFPGKRHCETEEGHQDVNVRVGIEVGKLSQADSSSKVVRILGVDCRKVKKEEGVCEGLPTHEAIANMAAPSTHRIKPQIIRVKHGASPFSSLPASSLRHSLPAFDSIQHRLEPDRAESTEGIGEAATSTSKKRNRCRPLLGNPGKAMRRVRLPSR